MGSARVRVERELVVGNKEGLHFRPIMQLVDAASKYSAQVKFHHGDREADGRSPMDLLMLVATQGTRLRLVTEGADAQEALDALARLIETGFGEE